jgi:hypothetical protein
LLPLHEFRIYASSQRMVHEHKQWPNCVMDEFMKYRIAQNNLKTYIFFKLKI